MSGNPRGKKGGWLPILLLVLVIVGPFFGFFAYEAHRKGSSIWDLFSSLFVRAALKRTGLEGVVSDLLPARPRIDLFTSRPLGREWDGSRENLPVICHLLAVDLDLDGLLDVVACDAALNHVVWLRQAPRDVFTEILLGEKIAAPAHAEAVDLDGDGDLDLLIAGMGVVPPNNDRIGAIILLENDGKMGFTNRRIVEKVARVCDVRAGDLDGDGDLDIAAAQFGYDDGETRWLENNGAGGFTSHILQTLSGPINCELADLDEDGDLDIVTIVSQEWEEIYVHLNDGLGGFTPRLLFGSSNEDFGSSGIRLDDFDQDGDLDILYTNGDAFDYIPPGPRPWHGVQWLENRGGLTFVFRRIGNLAGAYGGVPVDLDHDGDLDVVAVSAFNRWNNPNAQSLVWFENDGNMRFARRNLASDPTHILSLAVADFDGDGWVDLVTGGMHAYPPFDRVGRIILWRHRGAEAFNE